jgi:hypothetical protein
MPVIDDHALSALEALMDALDRRRALFFTGNILVEFDSDFIPTGPVTMVLDEDDLAKLKLLSDALAAR